MKSVLLFGVLITLQFLYADIGKLIPVEKIDSKDFAKAQDILKHYSIKRNLPRAKVKSTVKIYEYMLANLELTSKIVRFLEIGKYTVETKPDGRFEVDDKNGVIAKLKCIYRTKKMRVYLADGIFKAPFNLKIKAEGLIILKFVSRSTHIDTKAALFFKVENKVLDRLSKSANEIVGLILEKKSMIFVSAAQKIAEQVHKDATQLYYEMEASKKFTKLELKNYYKTFLAPKLNGIPISAKSQND